MAQISFLVFLGLVALSSAISYNGYKVYDVEANNDQQVQALFDLQKQSEYDFWSDLIEVGEVVRVMVSPTKEKDFLKYVTGNGLIPRLSIDNVQRLIDAQMVPARSAQRNVVAGNFSWTTYHNLATIHAWLDELGQLYPNVVTVVNIGASNEGRQIKGVVIDLVGESRGENPRIAMIEGGIHAREWISPATVTWIINEFLTSTDSDVRSLARNFIWHIFPSVNPDGYVYTFTNDRMWRKNRNYANNVTTCGSNNDLSNGVDLNRNFDYNWMRIGASANPCDQTYAGPSGASEPETRAIVNYVLSLQQQGNLLYYYAFHSWSQMILVPPSHVDGYDRLEVANYGDLFEIAVRGADVLTARHGTIYTVGTSTDILYAVSGSSFDWARGAANVPISFLFELRDRGANGFLLPADEIIENNEEVMDSLVEMDKVARRLRYYEASGSTGIISSLVLLASGIATLLYFN